MKGKLVVAGCFAVLISAALLWAGDPWKVKPYTAWNEKEIREILKDSPWARPGQRIEVREPLQDPASPVNIRQDVHYENTPQGPQRVVHTTIEAPKPPNAKDPYARYTVVWFSSRTIREAVARRGQLQGNLSEEKALQFLSQSDDGYTILITAADMATLEAFTTEQLLNQVYLQPQDSKQKVSPLRVDAMEREGRLKELRFHFPRELEGKQVIASETRKVLFHFPEVFKDFEVTFDLRKMVRDGKPDL